ncbi:MAG: 30S ribosomal protein S12 methylthiotransferase RimO [Firmicutes bacterium]|nr:30S ribosomal protein S12 methylthiotransferase RimO [Bacillota bacterium]
MTKLFIQTLGCPKNFNDSEGAAGILEAAGMEITEDIMQADAIMVNTCGFINDAKKESIDTIFDMIRFADECQEARGTRPLIIVSGCLSQRYGEDLKDELSEVDVYLGVNEYERLPEIIKTHMDKSQSGGSLQKIYCSWNGETFQEFSARKIKEGTYTTTLRIAEGCNNRCAYCVIPQIRGGYRSRPMENIISEAQTLAASGVKEVILIAQDVTEYGRDLYGEIKLPELLRKLCRVDGLKWIRLMYCYEDKISDELIEVMASEDKICNYIDIPIQHVSDNVLKGMKRRSTNESIRDTLTRLRKAIPDIHIRTTFITGFPGESEEDFEQLEEFVQEYPFERLGVFAYSREEGTVAGDMECQIDDDVKAARADSIMLRQIEISREVCQSKVGSVMDVLVEEMDEDGSYIGRTQYDAPEIDGTVIFKVTENAPKLNPGDMVKVIIEDAFDYDLTGTMV